MNSIMFQQANIEKIRMVYNYIELLVIDIFCMVKYLSRLKQVWATRIRHVLVCRPVCELLACTMVRDYSHSTFLRDRHMSRPT